MQITKITAALFVFVVLGLLVLYSLNLFPVSCSFSPMWDVIQLTVWHDCCHVPSRAPPYLEPTSAKSSRNASPIPSQRYDFMEGQFSSPRPSMSLSYVPVNILYSAGNFVLHERFILFFFAWVLCSFCIWFSLVFYKLLVVISGDMLDEMSTMCQCSKEAAEMGCMVITTELEHHAVKTKHMWRGQFLDQQGWYKSQRPDTHSAFVPVLYVHL